MSLKARMPGPGAWGLIFLCSLLSACGSFEELSRDRSRIKLGRGQVVGRRLSLTVEGGTPKQQSGILDAFRAELEDGNLFHSVEIVEPEEDAEDPQEQISGAALELSVRDSYVGSFGGFLTDLEGFIARFEMFAVLRDGRGEEALSGRLDGIAFDADTVPRRLSVTKKDEIVLAAHRNAATKFGDSLRELIEDTVEEELDGIRPLELPQGIGPLRLALINIDVKRAHPATQRSAIETDMLTAFNLGGSELEILSAPRVRRALQQASPGELTGLTLPQKSLELIERYLPARLLVMATVRSRDEDVSLEGAVIEFREEAEPAKRVRLLGTARARGRGIGAMRLAAIRLVRKLLVVIDGSTFAAPDEE